MKKLKIGLIGTGSLSDYHIRSFRTHPDVEVLAICDIDMERCRKKRSSLAYPAVMVMPLFCLPIKT